ncbi:hypothetical protein SAE02_25540 [Skermanella aerolata]|uniref:Uncharacterized protein n=1 Tax=Skermanella aerolata TaxID=393310 RepID=A0A512DPL5_9PROT|nr:hypothetical protein [Skermanella aerolata]KJB92692.1 hypothetical protein N826_22125 [Skermanella aerolata KACC 11604]GEO38406.1 hypothetical protein SAE02_25540 [Skermanella aerolata]
MHVVRVADHTQGLEVHSSDRFSEAYEEELERVLTGLFSACPDCASDAWEEVADDFDTQIGRAKVVEFALERGYDLRRAGRGQLVDCWRDIGIMLLARDRGLIAG